MSADPRVERARAVLAGARRRQVDALPPSVLMREDAELRRQLGQVLDVIGDQETDRDGDDAEPYCLTCREWVGIFHGGEGWRHFRGDWAPGGQRTLFEAGHEAVVGWIVPPGRGLSPAGLDTLRQALADSISYRDPAGRCPSCEASPAGLCQDHAEDLDKTDAYLALARVLGIEVIR